ncbi:hypothetical protein D3C80_2126260 [compost metagenome]
MIVTVTLPFVQLFGLTLTTGAKGAVVSFITCPAEAKEVATPLPFAAQINKLYFPSEMPSSGMPVDVDVVVPVFTTAPP